MTTKDRLAHHDSRISRLEQVMTELAEAQTNTAGLTVCPNYL